MAGLQFLKCQGQEYYQLLHSRNPIKAMNKVSGCRGIFQTSANGQMCQKDQTKQTYEVSVAEYSMVAASINGVNR
jgi:hypothetical protein